MGRGIQPRTISGRDPKGAESFISSVVSHTETEADALEFEQALGELDINAELTPDQRARLLSVLWENRRDAAPISTAPFRVSPEGRRFIEEEVAKLLASDVIEESDSPWATNVVLIKQRDDYLNQFQGRDRGGGSSEVCFSYASRPIPIQANAVRL
ncbi:hypothetical protein EXIGLDRAFT_338521 [Exidia glandulosa HHB12029]|uniref:Uncharacterized protein n=1 Tax=Exidia glandulosa HHB12029 TaxID=1314781 RepID=A0A165CJX8_EXIGL|nr:hypothetical protein EXIGLDRAFT_338521 [Exidia glandulosa HHB12029]